MTQNLLYKKPGLEEILSSALKLLAFEEPASRSARLKKLVVRQLAGDSETQKRFKQFGPLEIADQYAEIYRSDQTYRDYDQAINVVIALNDIQSFTNQAFKIWQNAMGWQAQSPEQLACGLSKKLGEIIESLKSALNLSSAQSQWLYYMANAAPGWSALLKESDAPKLTVLASTMQSRDLDGCADFIKAAKALTGILRPSALLLVEGQSECILLPRAMQLAGLNLDERGIHIIASGGMQQVVRRYLFYREIVALPIVCLLDQDASDASEIISDSLREIDGLLVLQSGELEDTFSDSALMDILNGQLLLHGQSLNQAPFTMPPNVKRKDALNRLFRSRGLGDFDKLEFAEVAVEKLLSPSDVPAELKQLASILTSRVAAI